MDPKQSDLSHKDPKNASLIFWSSFPDGSGKIERSSTPSSAVSSESWHPMFGCE